MFFLPMLIAVGALACLAGNSQPLRPSGIVSGRRLGASPPSPGALLVEYARAGRRPPHALISAALAEAQRGGHSELVQAIVETYIRPVVEAAEGRHAHRGRHATPSWTYGHPYPGHPYPGNPAMPMQEDMPPGPRLDYAASYDSPPMDNPGAPYPTYTPGPYAPESAPPEAFHMPPGDPAAETQVPMQVPMQAQGPVWGSSSATSPGPGAGAGPMIPLDASASDDDILRMIAHLSASPGQPVGPISFDPTAPLEGPASSTGTGTLTVSGRSSPIEGIGTGEWSRFCDRMSRELPTYTSAHHVGQFRQRRSHLLELGIDPETVLASPDGQQAAFDADMREAYRRAHHAGLLSCVGRPIEVSTSDGPPQLAQTTTSGVLAVVQAAGVDGAISWFSRPEDRRRFAGTTAVFVRANGVF